MELEAMIEKRRGGRLMMANSAVNNDITDPTNTQLTSQNFLCDMSTERNN